ncbi:MAG: ATP-binding protein [Candidatus Eremiobacteraeota bacterium]|nr:ATP-binding protein [Candidatus Eremiobacteraeota bacterium]
MNESTAAPSSPDLLDADEREVLASLAQEKHCTAGNYLFSEGDDASALYYITSGTLQIIKKAKGFPDEVLSLHGPGEFVGEVMASGQAKRFTSAQALADLTALEIHHGDLEGLIAEKPSTGVKLLGCFSGRHNDSDYFRLRMLEKKNEQILRSYEELKETQEELMRQERLAAVGCLASKIIHDIKGSVTPLKVYSENLEMLSPEAQRFGIEAIKHSINRIVRICEELLEYVKGTPLALRKARHPLREFIERELEHVRDLCARSTVAITTEYGYDGPAFFDDEQMGRVLQNLLLNAWDAMPDGGTLTVSTALNDSMISIEVSDTGVGIAEGQRERIFLPFVSIGKKKGTGLGLTISKKIIEEHGGTIEARSTPGKGTAFLIGFPAVTSSPSQPW